MRLLFIANDFPNPLEPTKAVFNLHLVRALARHHELQVISPVSWVDEYRARRRGIHMAKDRWAVIEGLSVHYPRYFYSPKILRSMYGWFYWLSVRGLVKSLVHSQRPDAVLAYWAHPDGQAAMLAGQMAGVPSAVIVGGSDVQLITKNAARYQCVEHVLRSIDSVIAVSQNLKEKVEAFGVEPARVHVWSQGVDQAVFFAGDKSDARAKAGIVTDKFQLLWVGRMVAVKGLETLLEACAILKTRGCNIHLTLIGDGPLRGHIESEAVLRGVKGDISFVGSCAAERLGDWYRAADLFVMSSHSEGLPNVLRESLACGTPFVASRVGGIPEIAGEGNGLFPAGDAKAMADEIALFIEGKRPAAVSSRPLTWDESARDIVRILHSINRRSATMAERLALEHPADGPAGGFILPAASIVITQGPAQSGSVCLTFDDGPDPVTTPRILDVLADHSVKATFFVLGEQADKHPKIIRRIVAEGHVLAQHSYSHERGISARQLIESVRKTQQALADITPAKVNLFRPPYGDLTLARLYRLWREKQTVVLWNRDPRDYGRSSAAEIIAWATEAPLCAGDIVLLHDTHPHTAAALGDLIELIRGTKLGFATIDQWIAKPAPLPRELVSA